MRTRHFPKFIAFGAAWILAFALAASGHAQSTDADFIAARDAYRAADAARLDRVAPRVKGHLLEQYVTYWQIRLKLDTADPERVSAFLTRYAGTPLADRLRTEWLKALAKRETMGALRRNIPSAPATIASSTATRSSGSACAMAMPSSTKRALTGPPGKINRSRASSCLP
jgi:soluble lytic murein transglycosylase